MCGILGCRDRAGCSLAMSGWSQGHLYHAVWLPLRKTDHPKFLQCLLSERAIPAEDLLGQFEARVLCFLDVSSCISR